MSTPLVTEQKNVNTTQTITSSPREEIKSPRGEGGMGGTNSSISSVENNDNNSILLNSNNQKKTTGKDEKDSVELNSLVNNSKGNPKGGPDSSGRDPDPISGPNANTGPTLPTMVSTILQRFLVRMPHTFFAMSGVFVPLYYGLDKQDLATSATTFVGVGGTVYCFVRAFFQEVIPEWMLAKNEDNKKWRYVMNITYTGFITLMFTSAVWKLPNLSAPQGLAFLTASFVAPYTWIAKCYPDIDQKPKWSERISERL